MSSFTHNFTSISDILVPSHVEAWKTNFLISTTNVDTNKLDASVINSQFELGTKRYTQEKNLAGYPGIKPV